PLLVMLGVAAVVDWRERRIRNWLTLCVVLSGVVHNLATPGGSLQISLLGLLVGFGLMLPQFVIGALGGGDVKLMAGIGAWLGWLGAVQVFLAASIVGLIIVLVQCAAKGRLLVLFGNTMALVMNFALIDELGLKHATETGKACRSVDRPLPYAVSVLIAVVVLVAGYPIGIAS
ncbi:MAG: prepilin peptidase, partial [Phycisphaerae bacterium]|nr:prepilin peptidase [Phycisphaerae bacterium]